MSTHEDQDGTAHPTQDERDVEAFARSVVHAVAPEHMHCPYEHEHPQPFVADDKLYCGACWYRDHRCVEMIPCTDETCIK